MCGVQYEEYRADLLALIHGNRSMEGVYITLRMRLRCEIFRRGVPIPGKVFEVLNEIVVDRGASPYLCKIECYERNRLITKVSTRALSVVIATSLRVFKRGTSRCNEGQEVVGASCPVPETSAFTSPFSSMNLGGRLGQLGRPFRLRKIKEAREAGGRVSLLDWQPHPRACQRCF